jgi:cytochrome c oxidase subunit 4
MLNPKPARKAKPNYVLILILLVVFTGMEISASYLQGRYKVPLLLTIAAVKATLVGLYFMHLKSDSRLYAVMFLIGAFLILPLLLIMLLVMPGL